MNTKTKGFRKKESSIDKVKGKTHSFPLVKQDGEKAEKILKEKKEKIENPDDSDELALALEKCIEDDKLIEFKDILTKYRNFYIEFKNTKKPKPEDMITWFSEVWWSNTINPVTIQHSFKKAGINL